MSKEKLLLVGVGGFGHMVAEQTMLQCDCVFVDDGQVIEIEICCGISVVGGIASLQAFRQEYSLLVVSIGNNKFWAQDTRRRKLLGIVSRILLPQLSIGPYAKIGRGCVVCRMPAFRTVQ